MRNLLFILIILTASPSVYAANYTMKDGHKYGYEQLLTDADRADGIMSKPMIMAVYLGKKGNDYQVAVIDGKNEYTVMQCENPCKYLKIMAFYGDRHQATEWMKTSPGMIGLLIMDDAIKGHLTRYTKDMDGERHYVWVDENTGRSYTPVKNK